MKIITHGNNYIEPSPPKNYACKCRQCRCKFEFKDSEYKLDSTIREAFTFRPAMYIMCPECHCKNYEWHWENN